ncbi:presequence protease [Holotrichia oblita]|uniref:Presequence protease n=1 Tax=Holotrichia oblita TaxID=644536 RepID=A0ACB9TBZ9_HOLOL|nr:presequence protease [Holotrichia oblita]
MPPVDSTPDIKTGNFELLYSLNAYNRIPVHEYKSKETGLTVVIAEVDGPVVNGFFCLVTEAFDDDGLPHTLEHLIFLGSETYPYKGVLDLLANRCLASGTNAWTDIDHTCYTMETAGSEGFLSLMPIFLDHILYPILSDEGFITEVHHITGEGDDAGVVYCEMQGRENSAESRLHLTMARKMYPGKCGYSSETGGIMKNLRETCNNTKVRNYHKEFYRPENLKVIITGQVKPEDVFKALEPLEIKIMSKGDRGRFARPWQNPCPPVEKSENIIIKYPSDDESNGIFSVSWRGPSAVKDQYTLMSCSILLKYLTDFTVSPLQKEFVEINDPYASKVVYSLCENSESCLYFIFENVPNAKLPLIKKKLDEVLADIVKENDIDMERMRSIINRAKLESLSNMENNPHHAVAFMIIGHMLYGNTKEDLQQRINPLIDYEKMTKETKSYWVNLLDKYFVKNESISIEGYPSVEEQQRMAAEEKDRIEKQVQALDVEGLKQKSIELQNAIEYNERPPPDSMLTSVNIPSLKSINFHNIIRYRSDMINDQLDLSDVPVFTYFDHVKSGFVYMFALMDTSQLNFDQKLYLPLLLESLFELPIKKDGVVIPYEDVVTQLNNDTVSTSRAIGLGSGSSCRFKCGSYSYIANIMLQVEIAKYEEGVCWLKNLLYNTVFTAERLKIIAQKMINDVCQAKRSGRDVVAYIMKGLSYAEDTNQSCNGILRQQKFLTCLLEDLESERSCEVLDKISKVRDIIIDPANLVLYFAGGLDQLKSPVNPIKNFLPEDLMGKKKQQSKSGNFSLTVVPDWKLLDSFNNEKPSCIVGMGCLESSFFYQITPSVTSFSDPDVPALMVYLQYLIQAEGPMWKHIRGKGLSYGYTISLKINEGLLCLVFLKATNVVGAYKEAYDIISTQLKEKKWDNTLIESAKSSLIFEIIEEEKTIGNVVSLSLSSYFQQVDYKYNRTLLCLIEKVTVDDLNRVGDKYIRLMFDSAKTKTAVVCDPSKADEIKTGFSKLGLDLQVYPSLEESFLNH